MDFQRNSIGCHCKSMEINAFPMVFHWILLKTNENQWSFTADPLIFIGSQWRSVESQWKSMDFHWFGTGYQWSLMGIQWESHAGHQLKRLDKPKQYSVRTTLRWKTSTAPGGPLGPQGATGGVLWNPNGIPMEIYVIPPPNQWQSMDLQWESIDFHWNPWEIDGFPMQSPWFSLRM